MPSNFACIGLDVPDEAGFDALIERLAPAAEPVGIAGEVTMLRWQDPSGARLMFGVRDGVLFDVLPGFAGPPGARFSSITVLNEEVVSVSVDDENGEQVTGMAVELEQRGLLPALPADLAGSASLTALGIDVTFHPDAAAFAMSEESLLVSDAGEAAAPPSAAPGLAWPPRMATESFVSYGVFAEPAEAKAHARLSGTVLDSARRVVEATGQPFIVARVRSVGFEADLCIPGNRPQPQPGSVVSGTVFLSASLTDPPRLPLQRRRRRS